MVERRGGIEKVKEKRRERGRGKEVREEKGEREDCLDVLDEQFGYAVWERGREREKAKRKREGLREGRGERERK
jgi:hypothetical protein